MGIKSLYVHIPFCETKCFYCSFFSIVSDEPTISSYIKAVEKEISIRVKNITPETIFIGGGTPSSLSINQLERLLLTIKKNVNFDLVKEFTIETNPNSLTKDKIKLCRDFGVNRVSIGIQSFNENKLRFLKRVHSAQQSHKAIELICSNNIENLNVDLIFGIPDETINTWKKDLNIVSKYSPEHIATYSLSYDEGTPLTELFQKGKIKKIDEEVELEMYLTTISFLTENGYEHYEVSNFAKNGYQCRHNITYWQNEDYIGIGASAVSYINGLRYQNISDVEKYIESFTDNKSIDDIKMFSEKLDAEKRARETLILGLRLRQGVDKIKFKNKTGFEVEELTRDDLLNFKSFGLIEDDKNIIRVSNKGLPILNSILEKFV